MTSDREPPAFPRVGESPSGGPSRNESSPLFTSEEQRDAASSETLPVEPAPRPHGSGGRWRWLVAGAATLAVIGVVAAVILLGGPRAGVPSVVEHYVPADTALYLDLKLDMPGDQRDKLAEFMSHFPGFADPAAFDQKIDEMLDQALRSADAGLRWQADVEPWFGGQMSFFGESIGPGEGTPSSMVVALTVKDRAALEALLTQRLADHEVDTLDHQGHQIRTFTPDPGTNRVSLVVTDELMLVSPSISDVQSALDVKAGAAPSLAEDEFFLQQLGALHADRLATLYYDLGRIMDSTASGPASMPGMFPGAECLQDLQAGSRVKQVGEIRAEGDHMSLTIRSQAPTGPDVPPTPQNKPNALAAAMPADAVAYAEFRQVGASAQALIAGYMECLDDASQEGGPDLRMLEQFLGVPPQDYLDFIDDVALAVTYEDGFPGGGLIATVDDEAVARQRLERLLSSVRALVAFGDADAITVEEIEHNGAMVTVFTARGVVPDVPETSLALSVANGRMYVGLNDFVIEALDRQQADSLSATERFARAVSAGGSDNAGVIFFDMARAREVIEMSIPAGERQQYDTEARPFIEPLTTVSVVNRTENGIVVSHVFLYVE